MTILYNCHTDGDEYRITKFTDGNVESTYLTSLAECQCPAGARPTCRHRQMLPTFIDRNLVNSPWFLDWDGSRAVVDFEGNQPAMIEPTPKLTGLQEEMILMGFHQPELCKPPTKPWRRL